MFQDTPQLIEEKEITKIYKGIVDNEALNNYIHFSIILPFYIGLPEKHCITIKEEGSSKTYSLLFKSYEYSLNSEKIPVSSVNMILFDNTFNNTKENLTTTLSHSFDFLLERLNEVIFSYKYASAMPYVHEVNMADLDVAVFYNAKVAGKSLKPIGLFILDNVPSLKVKDDILTEKKFHEFSRIHSITINKLNPFCEVRRLFMNATSLETKRMYTEALLIKQTAFERMLHEIFIRIYPDLGEEDYINTPFKKILTDHMPSKLGGNWSIETKSSNEVSNYYNGFYKLRCKIIHQGYKPSHDEYHKASKESVAMVKFIYSRIKSKKKSYQDLFNMVSED